jgi:hypothetical protein
MVCLGAQGRDAATGKLLAQLLSSSLAAAQQLPAQLGSACSNVTDA